MAKIQPSLGFLERKLGGAVGQIIQGNAIGRDRLVEIDERVGGEHDQTSERFGHGR